MTTHEIMGIWEDFRKYFGSTLEHGKLLWDKDQKEDDESSLS